MYLVKAKNILNQREYQASFETENEANTWLQGHISKNTFGKDARQAVREQDSFEESLVLSEFEDIQSEEIDGEIVESTRIIVSLKAEYTFEGPTLVDGSGDTEDDRQIRMSKLKESAAMFKVHKEFGETVEAAFGAILYSRNFTQEQKDQVQEDSDVISILTELRFGRIGKAKKLLDLKVTDEVLFFADDLSTISQFMGDFLVDYPTEG